MLKKWQLIEHELKALDTDGDHILVQKVVKRINNDKIVRLLEQILKAVGEEVFRKRGNSSLTKSSQLNAVDKM